MSARNIIGSMFVAGLIVVPAFAQDAPAAPPTGASLYAKNCNLCHSGAATANGPVLKGVAGGPIAAVKGYEYSDALTAAGKGKRWTDANLDAYLTNPRVWAPGGKMLRAVADPAQRQMIIAHLKTLK